MAESFSTLSPNSEYVYFLSWIRAVFPFLPTFYCFPNHDVFIITKKGKVNTLSCLNNVCFINEPDNFFPFLEELDTNLLAQVDFKSSAPPKNNHFSFKVVHLQLEKHSLCYNLQNLVLFCKLFSSNKVMVRRTLQRFSSL